MKPDEDMAIVAGINGQGYEITFYLNVAEIKHIRRANKLYDYLHPVSEFLHISESIHKKFRLFGLKRNNNSKDNRLRMNPAEPYHCNAPGCQINQNLTVDHVISLSLGGNNTEDNLQYLCVPHHNIKNLKERINEKLKEIEHLSNLVKKEDKKLKKGNWRGKVFNLPND